MDTFSLHQGTTPLLVSLPHDGTDLPEDVRSRLTAAAQRLPDTDWHVARLYAFARGLGASVLVPRYSRYAADLNRPPDGAALYPGSRETGLVPLTTFAGEPMYHAGAEPNEAEARARIDTFWRPYHAAIADELSRMKERHGRAVLWEGHSIRSQVPLFFEGVLPDLNLGTAGGRSCSPALQAQLEDVLRAQSRFGFVANGRFKGGYITRQYGDPANRIDAVQLEIAQHVYMDEASYAYDESRARALQPLLRRLLECTL